MAACAASRRLTLSNVLQGVFRTEPVRQVAERPIINFSRRPTAANPNSWLSRRSFSNSQSLPAGARIVTHDVMATKAPDGDVLDELTAPKAESSPETQTNPKDTSENVKNDQNSKKKAKEIKKCGAKETKSEPLDTKKKAKRPQWQIQKEALQKKFEEGWHPRRKLPPDSLDTIRHLHAEKPDVWTTPVLADQFKVSPEAIRRILKSKWQPTEEERERRQEKWAERYRKIHSHMEQLGIRPRKGEWTAQVSDARKLGLEEKLIQPKPRRRPRSKPAEGTESRLKRPDRQEASQESAPSE